MKIKTILPGVILAGFLAGCTGMPQPTLQEKMAGMNSTERADFLYHECRGEARYRSKKRAKAGEHNDHYHAEAETESSRYRLQMLCRRFYEETTGQEH